MSAGSAGDDPDAVHTLSELATAFDRLRGSRSYDDLDRAVRPPRLARSTLSNMLNGKSVPTEDTVVLFLTACGLDEIAQKPWLAARERVSTAHLRRPAGAVRVREARPRLLGVHASIQVDAAATDLPVYVPRDVDADLRTAISAAQQGGFVLLVGDSSVGKTRSLFEAVKAELPEWWLVQPGDAAAVAEFAGDPAPRTVVWLDELQRYLDATPSLPAKTVRSLIDARTTVVATVWKHEYTTRTAPRVPDQPDPYASDRELLRLAHVIDVPDEFSQAERDRAVTLAADRRIRVALDTPDAGFTQVLAAGPELVRRWENASDPYGKAIITAAVDARRVGATAPPTRDLLADAAPGYLTDRQQATAPADWLDQALEYATTPLHGAASALDPVPAGMGRIAGYTVADYLYQHALRRRRTTPVPDATWQAIIDHHHPDDTRRLADSADRRMHFASAVVLYRQAVNAGDRDAAHRLVELLADQGQIDEAVTMLRVGAADGDGDGDGTRWLISLLAGQQTDQRRIDELRARADAGNGYAAIRLVDLLTHGGLMDEGRIDELRARAAAGNGYAAGHLAGLLARQGRIDELRTRAAAGDRYAAHWLACLLPDQGRVDEAVNVLRAQADTGDGDASRRLVELLVDQGRLDELRTRADAGDRDAVVPLVELLVDQGQIDEAVAVLRARADAGDRNAARRLAGMLEDQGQIDEAVTVLRARVDAGDRNAAHWLAGLLANHGRLEEAVAVLRPWADAGDWYFVERLAGVLADQGQIDEAVTMLCTRADAGDWYVARRLVELLADYGRVDEAVAVLHARADAGDWYAVERLAGLLADHGWVEEAVAVLRAQAHARDGYAVERLAGVLADYGRVDEAVTMLRARADAGSRSAVSHLADLLANHGRVEDAVAVLRPWADAGDWYAVERLAELLANHGRVEDAVAVLRPWADAGDWYAVEWLVQLLADYGRVDEAVTMLRARADAGDGYAGERLVELLADYGRVDEAVTMRRAWADPGDGYAGERLVWLLSDTGRVEELEAEVHAGTPGAAKHLQRIRLNAQK
ncbi:hypothetical protein U2F26_29970 [Micromonospora sp. 4G57]|uniref:Tetratricopeptide repeat protein n=1 Tax=Micromonospora sicca TaxID=2202420 RepID=A0ABU5JLS7_9ACTN|nr:MULTISPECIES: hypothetical protein [unclassified Micromonospora]MDZ5446907.1 hypothetical protein [Micromonospora sp. 4G57]MDZ5493585.1 hypothetical protein [Micromonospora sp. 4G53]